MTKSDCYQNFEMVFEKKNYYFIYSRNMKSNEMRSGLQVILKPTETFRLTLRDALGDDGSQCRTDSDYFPPIDCASFISFGNISDRPNDD